MNTKGISGIVGGIIIAISIIAGALLISNPSSVATTSNEEDASVSTINRIFTIEDLAEYLSVSVKDIEEIIEKEDLERASIEEGSFDTYKYIPYLTISGQNRFLKSEIDKWLEYKSVNK
ncbi:MAG: helix-turn-helix domain-containing protein [Clostridium sp.]